MSAHLHALCSSPHRALGGGDIEPIGGMHVTACGRSFLKLDNRGGQRGGEEG